MTESNRIYRMEGIAAFSRKIPGQLVIFAALFFFFTACKKEIEKAPLTTNELDTMIVDSNALTYLALGDSYTIGESVSEDQRFPMQLAARLQSDSFPVSAVKIVARTGWTTGELASGIKAAVLSPPYDLVTLLIGVNNQYRGLPLEGYKLEFATLLQRAITLAGDDPDRVMVLSIPDYSVTPFGQNTSDPGKTSLEIDQFNAANQAIAAEQGVRYVDITPISREASGNPNLIADDDLHPSGLMYERWVALLEPVAKEILN